MPEDLTDSISGSTELVFPDDATGKYSLTERSVYDAEEVRLELDSDVPQYGSWIPVTDAETGQEAWLTAPSELRKALVENEISIGERFRIETMEKRGTEQSDPYNVELGLPEREAVPEDQSSLSEAES
jgi:hypothetical protein